MRLETIVEGHGEVEAVPVLLRRLAAVAAVHDFDIGRPIRRRRSELVREEPLQRAIGLALLREGCSGVLVLFDADGACAATLGPRVQRWAEGAAGTTPVAVVLAKQEYEAWFLATVDTLRGRRGIQDDAPEHANPESPRDAKRELKSRLMAGRGLRRAS